MITKLAKNGGHLGPNLGVVELTIALHYVFSTPQDKFVWDVSHQSYVHKLLLDRPQEPVYTVRDRRPERLCLAHGKPARLLRRRARRHGLVGGIDRNHAPIPALLAVAGVHHYLIREGLRTQVSLVLESGEPREVHHFALLIGYGCGGINPYLAFETIEDMVRQGHLPPRTEASAKPQAEKSPAEFYIKNYVKAVNKGVLKVMSKMGISTVHSYCGAQIFEAVGLGQDVIDKYFTSTPFRIAGIGLDVIAYEVRVRHEMAFADRNANGHTLDVGGHYQYRKEGEFHLFNPESVHKLQHACRSGNFKLFKEYSQLVNDQLRRLCTLRGLMEIKFLNKPIPIEEVEPVEEILKRFKTGAMSYGSISQEAHETLAVAMNRIGGKSNTGEGGEDPERYVPRCQRRFAEHAIKQVASGRFGVTSSYLVHAEELQIKMAQGAKPGEGGQLPGQKVYPWIAKVLPFDAGSRPDLAAAAPRHLLHRRPGRADSRPEERQPSRPHQCETGRRGGRRHDRGRGFESSRRRRPHQRP